MDGGVTPLRTQNLIFSRGLRNEMWNEMNRNEMHHNCRKYKDILPALWWSLIEWKMTRIYLQSVMSYKYTQHVFLAFFWLAMANSALNPLIYFSMNAK